jgi:hypothetical protein
MQVRDRKAFNAIHGGQHLNQKRIPQPGGLISIPADGLIEFEFGNFKKPNRHRYLPIMSLSALAASSPPTEGGQPLARLPGPHSIELGIGAIQGVEHALNQRDAVLWWQRAGLLEQRFGFLAHSGSFCSSFEK